MTEGPGRSSSSSFQGKTRESVLAVVGLASFLSTLLLYSPAVIPFLRSEAFLLIVPSFAVELLWAAVAFSLISMLLALLGRRMSFTLLVALGGAAYLCGSAALLFLLFFESPSALYVGVTAVICACGSVALCLAWGRIYSRYDMRQALIHTSLAGLLSVAMHELSTLLLLPAALVVFMLCALLAVILATVLKEDALGVADQRIADRQKLARTLKSLADVIVGPIIGLLFFAFIMGSMREIFAESYSLYLVSFAIVALILLSYALKVKGKLLLRGLHQTFIPLSAIFLLAVISITTSLGQGIVLTTSFIYLVFTFAAIITIASLCAIAHAAEFSSDLVFSVALFLFALLSVLGQAFSEMLVSLGINIVISVIATLYAFAMVLYGYLKRNREQSEQREVNAAGYEDGVVERCGKIASEHHLTARESEVLSYLARGHTGTYISEVLFISPNTARTHIHNIYKKLDITSREDVLRLTRREFYADNTSGERR